MNIEGYGVAQEKMTEATRNAGIDAAQLDSDMAAIGDAFEAALAAD